MQSDIQIQTSLHARCVDAWMGLPCPEHSATCRTESPISPPPPPYSSLLVRFFSVPSGPWQREVLRLLTAVTVSLQLLTNFLDSDCCYGHFPTKRENYTTYDSDFKETNRK